MTISKVEYLFLKHKLSRDNPKTLRIFSQPQMSTAYSLKQITESNRDIDVDSILNSLRATIG